MLLYWSSRSPLTTGSELDNGNRSVVPGYTFCESADRPVCPHSLTLSPLYPDSNGVSLEGANPQIDWMFLTTPQAGGNNKSIHYAQGKCLGGSSARNYMVYQRPTKGAMQKWADAVDDQSWTWENVLPYYERSTHFTPPEMSIRAANATPSYDASVFGNGPLSVRYDRD